jgi:hypothetical protein
VLYGYVRRPLPVERQGERVELDEHEAAARAEHAVKPPPPPAELGQPADRAVRRERDVESVRGGFEPVEDVGPYEPTGDPGVVRERRREGDGLVGQIDAGDPRAPQGQRQRVLPAVALQVHEVAAGHVAQQVELLGEQRALPAPQRRRLVPLVAVVGDRRGVPRAPVLFVGVAVEHGGLQAWTVDVGVGHGARGDCMRAHHPYLLALALLAACQGDADGDGISDADDVCPELADPDQLDTDADGHGDACDTCPNDAAIEPDDGCPDGVDPTDTDDDGVPDTNDTCPNVADPDQADADNDGLGDACDDCPTEAAPNQPTGCPGELTPDADNDGVEDDLDNCVDEANPDQIDGDDDGVGDGCDLCPVADGLGAADGCPVVDPNDLDGDGVTNTIDNCPEISNLDQIDTDNDLFGDACDVCDSEPAPGTVDGCPDGDGDGVRDATDNCPDTSNDDQVDTDNDTFGDVCDTCPTTPGSDNGCPTA